ncbi:hypothetical protein ABIA31_009457 [Catenulispora sp. MAP5-51]|uniref:hypothetical protein n=1 Tax=Catenulispora sp. MAP5-51 TaxID=3156298 RepID=UPI00351362E3
MNVVKGKREHAQTQRAEAVSPAALGRRGLLGGLAALPVLYSIGSATSAAAAAAPQPGSIPKTAGDLLRGAERRYHAPLLVAGTRLVLPGGVKAVSVQDYYRRPRLASAPSVWPRMTGADGSTVDASIVPERGAPTRTAVISGFTEGWYELIHANGRTDRVTWDAGKLSFLALHGEFGAMDEALYRDRLYTLALQPFSSNPYTRTTPTL